MRSTWRAHVTWVVGDDDENKGDVRDGSVRGDSKRLRGEGRSTLTAAVNPASRRRRTAAGRAFIPASVCMRRPTDP